MFLQLKVRKLAWWGDISRSDPLLCR